MPEFWNINNANCVDDQIHHEDIIAALEGLNDQAKNTLKHLLSPCIIEGFVVYDPSGNTVKIANDPDTPTSGGIAYDEDGDLIQALTPITGIQVDTTNAAINYVCVRHTTQETDNRTAYKTGVIWPTRISDYYEVVVRTEAQGILAGDVCLATTTGNGTTVTISTEDRTTPDYSGGSDTTGPSKVTGVAVTTGVETGKINSDILDEFAFVDDPLRCWIKVEWVDVTDPSGILGYEIALVPLDDDDDENIDEVEVFTMTYDQDAA